MMLPVYIPLDETIHLTVEFLFDAKRDLEIRRKVLQKNSLFHKSNQFSFQWKDVWLN